MVNGDGFLNGLGSCRDAAALRGIEGRLHQCGYSEETQTPVDELLHRDLVGGIEDGRRRAAVRQRPARERQRREADHVGLLEGQRTHAGEIELRRRRAHAHRPRQTMRNRDAHVGRSKLRHDRAVTKLDHAMDDGLRMHHHVEHVGALREQMMGLDEFEALVHQRRRIDGDFRSHGPGRMFERLLDGHFLHGLERPGAERPAGCSENDAAHVLAPAGAERLEDRVVLGIDRQHGRPRVRRLAHEECAGADETLLVGERDRRAALGGGKRWLEARGAGNRRHHPVGRPLRRLDDRSCAGRRFDAGARQLALEFLIGARFGNRGEARAQVARETRQRRRIAARGHGFDAVEPALLPEQVDGARADRAGGAQQRHRARQRTRYGGELHARERLRLFHCATIPASRGRVQQFLGATCRSGARPKRRR